MKFESEFNIRDEVYAFIDNVPTKCSIRKIEFPSLSRWFVNPTNDCILYSLVDVKKLSDFKCISERESDHILRYEREVGRTMEDLFAKILKIYKD